MMSYSEPSHKIARKIAKAKERYMSDTKWRKLFAVLHQLPGGCESIGLKLVGRTVIGSPLPGPEFEHLDRFHVKDADENIPFSQIEYIGLSNRNVKNTEIKDYLSCFGQWPIIEEDEGIVIMGYNWQSKF